MPVEKQFSETPAGPKKEISLQMDSTQWEEQTDVTQHSDYTWHEKKDQKGDGKKYTKKGVGAKEKKNRSGKSKGVKKTQMKTSKKEKKKYGVFEYLMIFGVALLVAGLIVALLLFLI